MIGAMETVVLSVYLLVVCGTLWLKRMNLRHLSKKGSKFLQDSKGLSTATFSGDLWLTPSKRAGSKWSGCSSTVPS
jgi:hypothetical protein